MAWDTAGVHGRKAHDYHGFTVVGCDSQDRWWTLCAERRKGPPTEIITYAVDTIIKYRPHTVSVEDVGQSGVWLELLGNELDLRKVYRPQFVYYSPESVAKAVRIALLQPRWERRGIILKPDQSAIRKQYEHFTLGGELEHEDELDSMVQHMDIAHPANDEFVEVVNPIDPEYVAREKRLARAAAAEVDIEAQEYVSGGIRGRNVWA
jgi:hypothetical protein